MESNNIEFFKNLLGVETVDVPMSPTIAKVFVAVSSLLIIFFLVWFVDLVNVRIHCLVTEDEKYNGFLPLFTNTCGGKTRPYEPSFMWKTDSEFVKLLTVIFGFSGFILFVICMFFSARWVLRGIESAR